MSWLRGKRTSIKRALTYTLLRSWWDMCGVARGPGWRKGLYHSSESRNELLQIHICDHDGPCVGSPVGQVDARVYTTRLKAKIHLCKSTFAVMMGPCVASPVGRVDARVYITTVKAKIDFVPHVQKCHRYAGKVSFPILQHVSLMFKHDIES